MPGGRLTQKDRQQIALGLADNLPYAEIARRLERPTSTVTREVMRNGGPVGYRAEVAHRATEGRTHRRKAAPSREAGPAALPHGRDPEALAAYEERFTTVMMQSGLSNKMMARVMVCLLTTDSGSMTAAELVQRLQVSPASVSKSIAFLEGQALVRRERDERRRERYVIDENLWYQSMIASVEALTQQAEISRQGVGVLVSGTPAAVRLENVARFLDFVAESLARAAQQAREVLHATARPPSAADPQAPTS
ncbi:helix-turn-helix domain-containing protein [Streptomyces sp. V4-01]|uniref:Helix-turn-helix domain-containing protein n=1 Tax=Actinacidiphila polyblastidii TaxID=3110430 RepID=A0ABU7PKJ1_9ACTN|nr:helix-turn-helix domain-containing protein [Streptomyces sp. V4-01]